MPTTLCPGSEKPTRMAGHSRVQSSLMTGDEKLARRYVELGCLFTAVGADVAILARHAEQLAARFKGQR